MAAPPAPVELQILSISDWHAQLTPLNGRGGAAALATYFANERAANPNTFTLTAGDAFGASPPISGFFDDVPAVEALGLMGIDVDTFGNHNFDSGLGYLQDLIDLASYDFVSANLDNLNQNLQHVKQYRIYDVGGVKLGVVGITNSDAASLTKAGSMGTLVVADPAAAAMRAQRDARADGAEVVIVIVHMGVTGFSGGAPFGPLVDFANGVTGFDMIFGDHTDISFVGTLNGQLVAENLSKGVTYTRAKLTWDPKARAVTARSATLVSAVSSAVTPDPTVAALVDYYFQQLKPLLSTVIGTSSVAVPRSDRCGGSTGRLCESLVGDIVTDALRAAYGTDFAITNAGGLRAALTCPLVDDLIDFCPAFSLPGYPITNGQVLTVLPFGNESVTLELNGAELKAVLENGVSQMPGAAGRFQQVSGLCFSYDISLPVGSRVTSVVRQLSDGSCAGAPVDLTTSSTYTLTENDFMAAGNEGHPDFNSRATSRNLMDQDVTEYIKVAGTITPAYQNRITCTTSGATACPILLQ